MRSPVSKMITEIEPSGIRRFFDAASTAAYYLMEVCDEHEGNYSK